MDEQPPLPRAIERFDVKGAAQPKVRFEFRTSPELPRYWFENQQGTELIQVQRDRLAFNWRRVRPDDEYPHYEHVLAQFLDTYHRFQEFVAGERLGEVRPNQCEVTYVNHMKSGEGWDRLGQVADVVTLWCSPSTSFPGEPETVRFVATFLITGQSNDPLGRLHVTVEPAFALDDGSSLLVMQLTARGGPLGEGIEGVRRFMDVGHDWINRTFLSITSSRMHEIWRIRDGH